MSADGYWYTRANGEREWREAPRCDCGGSLDGKVLTRFLKPSTEAIAYGRVLAERYGW